jgi:hypothetical protein
MRRHRVDVSHRRRTLTRDALGPREPGDGELEGIGSAALASATAEVPSLRALLD